MKCILLLLSIMVCSCGPQEPFEEQRETTKVDSSYYFRDMAELELETQQEEFEILSLYRWFGNR